MERSFSNAANLSVQQSTPSIFHGGFFLHLFGRLGSGPSRRARSSAPSLLAPAIHSECHRLVAYARRRAVPRKCRGLSAGDTLYQVPCLRTARECSCQSTWPAHHARRDRTATPGPFHLGRFG